MLIANSSNRLTNLIVGQGCILLAKLLRQELYLEAPHLIYRIHYTRPIQLDDLAAGFGSLSSLFERHIKEREDLLAQDAHLHVVEVKQGSIEVFISILPAVLDSMGHALVLEDFVLRYWTRIKQLFSQSGGVELSKSDFKDFSDAVVAVANDPNGSCSLEAAFYVDGRRKIKAGFKFNSRQARAAQKKLANMASQAILKTDELYRRELMMLKRVDKDHAQPGRVSGERGIIESIHPTDLPLIFASDITERRIRREVAEARESVFFKGFVVDVHVEKKGGRPVAYKILDLHDVIDLN